MRYEYDWRKTPNEHDTYTMTGKSLAEWRKNTDDRHFTKSVKAPEPVIPVTPRPMLRVYLPRDSNSIEVSTVISIPMGTLATVESIHAYIDNLSKRWAAQVEKQVRDKLWAVEEHEELDEDPF